jgi:hypothetical protein
MFERKRRRNTIMANVISLSVFAVFIVTMILSIFCTVGIILSLIYWTIGY